MSVLGAILGQKGRIRETDDHTISAAPGRRHWLPNLYFLPYQLNLADGSSERKVAVVARDKRSYWWVVQAPPPMETLVMLEEQR